LNADGTFLFSECKSLSHEKRIEGKYVIATAEKSLDVLEAVAIYKDLAEVERGFRQLKDVLALRPIYHQVEPRIRAHVFVATLAQLVQRLLDRRLKEAGIEFSAVRAMEVLSTVRHVTFRVQGQEKRCGVAGGITWRPACVQGAQDRRPPAADTVQRISGHNYVVTNRKFGACAVRTYDAPRQTWASWLNQVEIYFSIIQRKVFTPNDFASLEEVEQRLHLYEELSNQEPRPFDWKFDRVALLDFLERLDAKRGKLPADLAKHSPRQPTGHRSEPHS
jgi:hypothetical protein